MIDDEAEPVAQAAQRIDDLMRDVEGDLDRDLLALHRLPVSSSQVSLIPPSVKPREYPISNVPGTK